MLHFILQPVRQQSHVSGQSTISIRVEHVLGAPIINKDFVASTRADTQRKAMTFKSSQSEALVNNALTFLPSCYEHFIAIAGSIAIYRCTIYGTYIRYMHYCEEEVH